MHLLSYLFVHKIQIYNVNLALLAFNSLIVTNPSNVMKVIKFLVVISCGLENICENILNWEWELSVSSQASKCVFNYLQDNFYDHNCSSLNFLFNHFSLHTTCICNISSQSCQNI